MVARQVITRYGAIEGLALEDPNITAFRGVPFAAPPVGELRWRAPQPLRPWDGVLKAHDFSPISMQPMSGPDEFYGREWGVDPATPRSEDSLYLNIWTPALRGSGDEVGFLGADNPRLPVLVWIYGGAYQCGTASEKEFDGASFARRGIVVVTVSYRLNVFGFFTHPGLRHPTEPTANFGMLDQQAAIAWVKNNIEAFGGDPGTITVAGQSAGSASVLAQCASASSDGLFQRAIMQSGGGLGVFNEHLWSLAESQRNGERFLASLGVSSIDEARSIPAAELLDAACAFPVPPDSGREGDWPMLVNWIPCVDGRFLTDQYGDALLHPHSERHHRRKLLIGNTTGEFTVPGPNGTPVPEGELGNIRLANAWIEAGDPKPFFYRFDVQMPGDDAGAFHSSDLWFTFNTLHTCWRPFSGWHYDLSAAMCDYWANFIRTGDPNGSGYDGTPLPRWDAFDPSHPQAMRFGRESGMESLAG
ncbi:MULTISPECIES: carboxylesterase/lipase family protein [Bifidobacterium]|uniref:carboxylesterase/lipase family protein n=1 Tax=Bifidobacterium TaxID=1678 RepID=UPI001BDBD893|nr:MULTISPECIES: carboxylesterase family protein [Bifidobacterium]MBT1162022.1 carboxylesterase family protein [Bifidobacterium sp. SO1]MBW3078063.1 carboxylesterase family protein [Bifidobacterium simiiventris]